MELSKKSITVMLALGLSLLDVGARALIAQAKSDDQDRGQVARFVSTHPPDKWSVDGYLWDAIIVVKLEPDSASPGLYMAGLQAMQFKMDPREQDNRHSITYLKYADSSSDPIEPYLCEPTLERVLDCKMPNRPYRFLLNLSPSGQISGLKFLYNPYFTGGAAGEDGPELTIETTTEQDLSVIAKMNPTQFIKFVEDTRHRKLGSCMFLRQVHNIETNDESWHRSLLYVDPTTQRFASMTRGGFSSMHRPSKLRAVAAEMQRRVLSGVCK